MIPIETWIGRVASVLQSSRGQRQGLGLRGFWGQRQGLGLRGFGGQKQGLWR